MSAGAVAFLVAFGIAGFLAKARWNYWRLPELPVVDGPPPNDVWVIVPARDEEPTVARCIASFTGARVLVVDDGSRDATAEIAREAGADVIAAPPLRKGMLGKPNACLAGANATESRWLLFVDADTYYDLRFLTSLLAYANDHKLVAASVFLRQERKTFFERLLLPYAFALYFCGVDSSGVNNPRSPEALANGQCLLFRRDAYEFIGGHSAVANSVIEDVALARVVKRHRMPARVLRAERLGTVRMYDGFRSIWRGFQKNSFRFLLVNPWSGLQVIAASILLTSYLPVLVWLVLENRFVEAAAFALVPAIALLPWYGISGTALLAPGAIYAFQIVALNAMFTTLLGRKAVWKGRHV